MPPRSACVGGVATDEEHHPPIIRTYVRWFNQAHARSRFEGSAQRRPRTNELAINRAQGVPRRGGNLSIGQPRRLHAQQPPLPGPKPRERVPQCDRWLGIEPAIVQALQRRQPGRSLGVARLDAMQPPPLSPRHKEQPPPRARLVGPQAGPSPRAPAPGGMPPPPPPPTPKGTPPATRATGRAAGGPTEATRRRTHLPLSPATRACIC